ncbi:hypothetical protein [Phenylobacterium sp.]|uniref:hypothetical protein n=1 Tax=Phenylobacterium sp. TaxID=1871053 RepID=UPI0025FB18D2|nr:hypothetical protein [Phenylobacterium sp.]
MADVSISPDKLPDVFPDKLFSQVITASGANGSISISNTTIEVISANTRSVFLANSGFFGLSSVQCQANGIYVTPFTDTFQYVFRGSSTNYEDAKSIVGTTFLPKDQDYFDLDQDLTEKVTKQYRVTVNYENTKPDGNTSNSYANSFVFVVEQDIINDFDRMRVFVQQYYENRPFFSNTA